MGVSYKIFSKKIREIPYLPTFLQTNTIACDEVGSCQAVIGWGLRPTSKKAREYARRHHLPYIALEDGFLRSFAPGQNNPPLSLVVDDMGIYYDASRASALENLLNSSEDLLTGKFADGTSYNEQTITDAVAEMLTHNLSKYNNAPDFDRSVWQRNPQWNNRRKVLIIDQTAGDMSIQYAGADSQTFNTMLTAARRQYPDAVMVVKTHPQVSSKDKIGHFAELQEDDDTCLLQTPSNPIQLLRQVDSVYTVSSTMGFEALLVGKTVHCFGIPWYAGWGATEDILPCPRRTQERSVRELFAAAYCRYTRYLNPETKQLGNIFHVMTWLKRQKKYSQTYPADGGRMLMVGFRRWKATNVKPLLSLHADKVCFIKGAKQLQKLSPQPEDKIVYWGNVIPDDIQQVAKNNNTPILRMEDGFLRSVGLGSDLIAPNSIVLDGQGLYFDCSSQSELEEMLCRHNYTSAQLLRAEKIRKRIVNMGLSKYNTELHKQVQWVGSQPRQQVVLVAGQVEDDASIRFGCTTVDTNLQLLKVAREENPTAFVVYKPHPDVQSRNRRGAVSTAEAKQYADHIETVYSMVSCIEVCNTMYTMTSLSGFDALLRDKDVVVYGKPFYAGWGLTRDKEAFPERRNLPLAALVYATLVAYPLYWDWLLKGYTNCEGNIDNLVRQRVACAEKGGLKPVSYWQRQWRKTKILWHSYVASRNI